MFWPYFIIALVILYFVFKLIPNDDNQQLKSKSYSIKSKPKKTGFKKRIESLHDLVNRENIVFLDTETTGLSEFDQVIELGIVTIDGKVLIDTLIKPTVKINPEATKKHGLKMSDLKNAPSWPEVYEQYVKATEGKTIMAYNSKYDKKMIQQTCKANKITNKRRSWGCVMLAYSEFMGHDKWYKLEDAVINCEVSVNNESDQQHRAVYDAAMAAGVFQYIKQNVNHSLNENK